MQCHAHCCHSQKHPDVAFTWKMMALKLSLCSVSNRARSSACWALGVEWLDVGQSMLDTVATHAPRNSRAGQVGAGVWKTPAQIEFFSMQFVVASSLDEDLTIIVSSLTVILTAMLSPPQSRHHYRSWSSGLPLRNECLASKVIRVCGTLEGKGYAMIQFFFITSLHYWHYYHYHILSTATTTTSTVRKATRDNECPWMKQQTLFS